MFQLTTWLLPLVESVDFFSNNDLRNLRNNDPIMNILVKYFLADHCIVYTLSTAACFLKKVRERVCGFQLRIVFKSHLIFPRMCGNLFTFMHRQ